MAGEIVAATATQLTWLTNFLCCCRAEANGIGFGPWLQYNIAPSILSLILDYLCLLVFYKVIGLVRGHSLVETIRLQPYFVDSIQDQQAMAYAASVDVLSTDSMTPHDHAVTSLMSIRSTASTRC